MLNGHESGNPHYSEITDLDMEGRPHVVILGAGASLASFPEGDKNGNKLPLMINLVEVCELKPILNKYGVKSNIDNFEELYSHLYDAGNSEVVQEIENKVSGYFGSLNLPDYPTLYDYLVISLRKKDLIATFNWDPFLWQALLRNSRWIDVPNAAFLHGNVSIGYCPTDMKMGKAGTLCPICRNPYDSTPLLYPISKKNYQSQFIGAEWFKLERYLNNAYMITVFGYSAPESDIEAISLMEKAYKVPGVRKLEQIEIIDIRLKEELCQNWSQFILEHHYQICDNFYNSWIAHHPRRTCDTMWQQLMELQFIDSHHFPRTDDWQDIYKWYQPLIEEEKGR